jgi:4-diphosphocytidyl-2-C-methyl-D-erythritol kinase
MSPPNVISVPAYAKINLTLAVLGKRADGYHDLASIMQTVSLHDTLQITPTRDGAITCEVDTTDLQSPDNLALRAAALLRTQIGDPSLGAQMHLRKEIPMQGGLGGGSSDAAAVLLALNRLWGAGRSDEQLEQLGAQLGSDVPYFIAGGSARIAERGEVVTPLPDAEPLWLVLAKPPVSIATAVVFCSVAPHDYSTAEDTDAVEQAIVHGQPLPFDRLTNTLEPIVFAQYPAVVATRHTLLAAGAPLVRMSGSGPTLYVPYRSHDEAAALFSDARERGLVVWLCQTVSRAEYYRAVLGPLATPQ